MKQHPFEPIYFPDSTNLILGTFPSVRSRQEGFYYGHPQNRFWKVLASIYQLPIPVTKEEKTALLQKCKIALWDVIESCDIEGSADNSIQNVVANDLGNLLLQTSIQKIYANGSKAASLYKRFQQPVLEIPIITLPSTSPANASFSLERLCERWQILKE